MALATTMDLDVFPIISGAQCGKNIAKKEANKLKKVIFMALAVLLLLTMSACRRVDVEPTPMPTVVATVPPATIAPTATPMETVSASPEASPAASPEGEESPAATDDLESPAATAED